MTTETTETTEESTRGQRKNRVGTVVSNSTDKTIVVLITRRFKHAQYGKYVTRSKKYHVHDERNECAVGDRVLIEETRPISRLKRWRLKSVVEKAPVVD